LGGLVLEDLLELCVLFFSLVFHFPQSLYGLYSLALKFDQKFLVLRLDGTGKPLGVLELFIFLLNDSIEIGDLLGIILLDLFDFLGFFFF
jgi:hypothetical protein